MAEIINLDDYRTVCQDCIYHTEKDGLGICTYPGGWEWDKNFIRCFTFRRKIGQPVNRKGETDNADNGN